MSTRPTPWIGWPTSPMRGPSLLTIDLRPLTFVDSTGVRALLVTLGRTRAAGVTLRIVRAGPRVQRVFELLCLDTVLPFIDPDD